MAVGDHDGRLVAGLQRLPHRGDVLGQPRPAGAAGASARMLVYHFGTRDALLRAVLGRARQRQLDLFNDLLRVRPGEPYTATLGHAWTSITGPDGQPYLRMFGRLRESAEQQLWPDFRRTATTGWLGPLEEGLRSIGRPDLATLVLAVIRGLLMDLDATGDTARTDRAFRDFLGSIEHLSTTHRPYEPATATTGTGTGTGTEP
ncbi:TetR/AcrR family transcriptional regulator [Actinacidiphila sp. ITFR-21]|uniref:TetR/AcrR family transcriptional regulator n=1 Tax=Actinacidiphila sp. ITFR-21 TaxID=3075199 RepID=UPI00288B07DD|nr:TetR/AcrR family transcriptional regulator [Streptomyces sp. ITFR-21]WNI17221.1 TetR/AcrR family transcriptional regulator [Streptomyces sp. ITFR-21]